MKKVALPSKGEMIDNHFGHCEKFTIVSLNQDNDVVETVEYKGPDTCGCKSDLAADLAKEGVSVLLAGGIGQGAINKLKAEGIDVFTGYSGEVKDVLVQWLRGNNGNYSVCPPHSGDGHECQNH